MTTKLDEWEVEADRTLEELTHPELGLIRIPEAQLNKKIKDLISIVKKQHRGLAVFRNWMNDRSINKPDDEVVKLSRTVMEIELREALTEVEELLK